MHCSGSPGPSARWESQHREGRGCEPPGTRGPRTPREPHGGKPRGGEAATCPRPVPELSRKPQRRSVSELKRWGASPPTRSTSGSQLARRGGRAHLSGWGVLKATTLRIKSLKRRMVEGKTAILGCRYQQNCAHSYLGREPDPTGSIHRTQIRDSGQRISIVFQMRGLVSDQCSGSATSLPPPPEGGRLVGQVTHGVDFRSR